MRPIEKERQRLYWELPSLPFSHDALEPIISSAALKLHHLKHHQFYVEKLNSAVRGTRYAKLPIDELITKASGTLYTNAAQVWNHNFFWNCLSPQSIEPTSGKFYDKLLQSFGSLEEFKGQFIKTGEELFGSGYVWLVRDKHGDLAIKSGKDAYNPLTQNLTPLLVVDVWEHAYYLDYLNSRRTFLKNIWEVVNWQFVESQFRRSQVYLG